MTSTSTMQKRNDATYESKDKRNSKKEGNSNVNNHTVNAMEKWIPLYLRRWVQPYYGDFCCSRVFLPSLMAQLMSEGFLPIATPQVLLPKLHQQRCVINLASSKTTFQGEKRQQQQQQRKQPQKYPCAFHVSKSTRKKAKRFTITLNRDFTKVVEGCQEQHGEQRCWLYPRIVKVFEQMHQTGSTPAMILSSCPQKQQRQQVRTKAQTQICPVRFFSVEVWNAETGALAAGELGYTVGSVYTSLTGFSRENSAGSVQLAALGHLLTQQGFTLWDLGMEMEYKMTLGCQLISRSEFVEHIHRVRCNHGHLELRVPGEEQNTKDIISPESSQNHNGTQPLFKKVQMGDQRHDEHHKPPTSKEPERIKRVRAERKNGILMENQLVEEEKKSDDLQ